MSYDKCSTMSNVRAVSGQPLQPRVHRVYDHQSSDLRQTSLQAVTFNNFLNISELAMHAPAYGARLLLAPAAVGPLRLLPASCEFPTELTTICSGVYRRRAKREPAGASNAH